ncbi:MAG TPA: hypothetical protein VEK08_03125 [Planctomycetota bacterium]|nr:hypothetical protein [Planctomycetota bacterium]
MTVLIGLVYGTPQNMPAAIGLTVPVIITMIAGFSQSRCGRRLFYIGLGIFYFLCFVPAESSNYQDLSGGRHGVEIFPGMLFGKPGFNTALIEARLGPRPPRWKHASIRSLLFGLGSWRDGNERVDICSLAYKDWLSSVLAKLPSQEAQTQVLKCLTDERNFMRVHQGLLLTGLLILDYPAGNDAESWWRKHRELFRREYNAHAAVRSVAGWRQRMAKCIPETPNEQEYEVTSQIWAAKNMEFGGWGGNIEFYNEFERLRLHAYEAHGKEPSTGVSLIEWWPELEKSYTSY